MKKNTFYFKYNIQNLIKDDSSNISFYEEYFIPYNNKEILQSPLQDFLGNEFYQLFENEIILSMKMSMIF